MTMSGPPAPRLRLSPPREHPMEIAVVLVVLMLGTTAAIGVASTGTVSAAARLAPVPLLIWSIGLVLASLTVLVSVFIGDPLRAVTVEAIGLVPFGLLLVAYGAVVVVSTGPASLGPWLWAVLGAAALVRALQIRRTLEQVRAALHELRGGDSG